MRARRWVSLSAAESGSAGPAAGSCRPADGVPLPRAPVLSDDAQPASNAAAHSSTDATMTRRVVIAPP